MKTVKYTRAGLEALVQKAGVLSREMDAKLERMEALVAEAKGERRECEDWSSRCARHEKEMRCAGELTLLRMRRELTQLRMRRCWGWVLVVLVVLVVDVVVRFLL